MKTQKDIYRQKDLKTAVVILCEFLSPQNDHISKISLLEYQQRLTRQITEGLDGASDKVVRRDLNDIKGLGHGKH